jgi:hypothetical protein
MEGKKIRFWFWYIWKYAQTVGPAYLGAPTHPGKKKKLRIIQKFNENSSSYFMWWSWNKTLAKF